MSDLSLQQAIDIRFHQRQIVRDVVIDTAVMGREHRVEAFLVEIAAIDLVAGLFQALASELVKRPAVAFIEGVGVKDEYAHVKSSKSLPAAVAVGVQLKTSAPFVPASPSFAA